MILAEVQEKDGLKIKVQELESKLAQ